jgi:LPXTG-motif cell wall-anchored protein
MEFKLTIQYKDTNGNTHYKTVDQRSGEAGEWVQLSNPRFQIPSDAASDMILYVEAVSSTADFYVDEFVEAPLGYTASVDRETGKITLTYSSGVYNMTLDEDTSIAPKVVIDHGDEIVRNTKENKDTFTISNANNWTKSWSTKPREGIEAINEASDRTYEYYVKEIKVNGVPVDENGFAGDYKVSYSGNNVQTNSSDNPILISNKYIWYRLPDTGGIGVDFIYAIGLFLMITGLIGGTALIRRERRSD